VGKKRVRRNLIFIEMETHRMPRIFKAVKIEPRLLFLLAPAIFLFVLPLPHTTGLRSVAFGISVLWLALTWKSNPTPTIPLKKPFAAWLTLALLTLIWAIHPEYSLGEIRTEIVYGFFTFLVFFKATQGERELNIWFVTITASAILVGVLALTHSLRGLNPYLVGMHGGTLYYAGYLNTIFPMLAVMAILRPGWQRVLLICLMVFLLYTAIGSTSRAVWVALVLELAIFGGLYFRYMEVGPVIRRLALAASVAALVIFCGAFLYVAKQKLQLSGGPAEIIAQAARADRRPKLWIDSITFIKERPLTGAGFGRMVLGKELIDQQNDINHTHAHNIILNYALQLGLLGPVVLFFLFYCVVREFWRLTKSSSYELKVLGIAGISILGGIFGQSMVEDIFVRHLAWLFWALAGMTLGYALNRKELGGPASTNAVSGH
jgi:O-antigen ligase